MPFTDLATVRKHLVASNLPETKFENVRVRLDGLIEVDLPHANLESASERVKRIASNFPTVETGVLMVDEKEVALTEKLLIRDTLTMASDRAVSAVYTEEQDYRVDHDAGVVTRMSTGTIPNSFPVVVWYDYYELFSSSADYVIDYVAGTVRRSSGSSIPDGGAVLIDYSVAEGWAEDALINQAILEAQDIIVRALREGYSAASTDQGLQSGATYLTLAIVSRGMAALMLSRNKGSDANSRAREWRELCDKWSEAAWNVLAPFVNPHSLRSIVVE
ncbi:MAG: hypothetical protein KDB65_09975 [Calditrichaeota bacterium]|nr:hypothetical protein [Calditrichota bacterium]MCB9369520.1 hypothetical protein [Calditrichota bacterium]